MSNVLRWSTTEASSKEMKRLVWARSMDILYITKGEKIAFEDTDANR